MKIESDFAILDVKLGRTELAEHFKDRPRLGPCPEDLRIPVTIVGYIDDVASRDDGTSIEFSVQVTTLDVRMPLQPSPYKLNQPYQTQGGETVTLIGIANEGTSYETMHCEAGIHRYTRRDFGRVTGSAHDYSDPRNIPRPT